MKTNEQQKIKKPYFSLLKYKWLAPKDKELNKIFIKLNNNELPDIKEIHELITYFIMFYEDKYNDYDREVGIYRAKNDYSKIKTDKALFNKFIYLMTLLVNNGSKTA